PTSPITRSCRGRSVGGSIATRWGASPLSCSSSWRCRSASIISSSIPRSAPASSSSTRSSPPSSRSRPCSPSSPSAPRSRSLDGCKGVFGWIAALPWHNPIMLAAGLSFAMLGFGGAGGVINMSYQLDTSIHNTQWITGHFHLIFGGAIVIMYFAIAYDLWPHLTGRALTDLRLIRAQLWLWFIGMIITTFPWHYVGILGMPRRMAYFDFTDSALSAQALPVILSVIGALILLISGLLLLAILVRSQVAPHIEAGSYRFSEAVHPPTTLPVVFNSFGLWVALMIGL